MGDHDHFLKRIQKTLYFGKLPTTDRLSLPVTELASELFSEPHTGRSLDRLHCKDAAYISREACISPCTFVLAMLYLERLKACNPEYLQCVAPSQLFLVSLMVSSKFLYDYGEESGVVMSEWAESGGISIDELVALEREFLSSIQWDIFVKEATFWQKFNALEETLAQRETKIRGHFTYAELETLSRIFDLQSLLNALATIMAVLVTTYTAGLLTILASMYIASQIPGHLLNQPSAPSTTSTTANRTYFPALVENDTSSIYYLDETDDNKKSLSSSRYAVDVLQTSILLASIQSAAPQENDFHDDITNNSNREDVTWDWWNSPSMTWLSHASRLVETLRFFAASKLTQDNFMDMSIANSKKVELVDKLHKGTKIRMQDLLESSWHTEWTDTISGYFPYKHLTQFFQEVKA